MVTADYLTSREAAQRLGIRLRTLYAYVSRGLLHSEIDPGDPRSRRYLRDEVERLRRRSRQRRDPSLAVAGVLDWGVPVLDSAITLIDDGHYYYRGIDVADLVHAPIESVAHLLWLGELPQEGSPLFAPSLLLLPPSCRRLIDSLCRDSAESPSWREPVEVIEAVLPVAASLDLESYELRRHRVAQTGARLLSLAAASAARFPATPDAKKVRAASSVAELLQRSWLPRLPAVQETINAALVLCADHELNVSAFTARCVASAESTPYSVVIAGLCALRGRRHGGHSTRVEALLQEALQAGSSRRAIRAVLGRRLKRGEAIPGCGQPLYPQGDPRYRLLMAVLGRDSAAGALDFIRTLGEEMESLTGEQPTIDAGLAALSFVYGLAPGSALALFAIGRVAGWIGQAIEQYQSRSLIRPRARYTGPPPRPQRA